MTVVGDIHGYYSFHQCNGEEKDSFSIHILVKLPYYFNALHVNVGVM